LLENFRALKLSCSRSVDVSS